MDHSQRQMTFWALKYTLTIKKKTEIMQSLLSDRNGIKLEINNRKVAGKTENT